MLEAPQFCILSVCQQDVTALVAKSLTIANKSIGKLLSSPLICDFSRHLGYESQVSSSINRDVEFVDFGPFLSR